MSFGDHAGSLTGGWLDGGHEPHPTSIAPDTKDWTWVLERPCAECGFDPAAQGLADLPRLVHDTAMTWSDVLAGSDVGDRPAPDVWSPLEYGCHVRDVHVLFAQRLRRCSTRTSRPSPTGTRT